MDPVFEQLYEKYHDDLFNFLFYMVRNREHAEDLVQEVYVKVLRSYKRFKGQCSEKTWLLSIARHVAIDFSAGKNIGANGLVRRNGAKSRSAPMNRCRRRLPFKRRKFNSCIAVWRAVRSISSLCSSSDSSSRCRSRKRQQRLAGRRAK